MPATTTDPARCLPAPGLSACIVTPYRSAKPVQPRSVAVRDRERAAIAGEDVGEGRGPCGHVGRAGDDARRLTGQQDRPKAADGIGEVLALGRRDLVQDRGVPDHQGRVRWCLRGEGRQVSDQVTAMDGWWLAAGRGDRGREPFLPVALTWPDQAR